MERSTVYTLLHDLAESSAPPSTVDITLATSAGRRAIRLRRVLAGGSAAIAVAAVAGILGVVISGGAAIAPPPGPAGSASRTTAPPDRLMPEQAPSTFDPTVRYAELGWIPDGATDIGFTATSDWLSLDAMYPVNGKDPGSVSVVIVTAGHGVDPGRSNDYAVPADSMPEGLEVPPVNGRPAQFSSALGEAYVLRWEYAPGAWAAVVVRNVDDVKDVARQVATDVRLAANIQVRLPYHTTGLPVTMPVRYVQAYQSTDGAHWNVTVQYGQELTSYGDWPLNITAIKTDIVTGDGAVIGDPNATVDGHPARTSTGVDGGSGLQLFNVNGVYLEMLTHSPQATAQLPGGLVGLFRGLEIYPDPANWR